MPWLSWLCIYGTLLFLYFFSPSAGPSDTLLLVLVAETYLQYETLLSGIILTFLIFTLFRKLTWQHIRILDKVAVFAVLGSVLSTILAQQVTSLWVANLFWFFAFGLICIHTWCWWKAFVPDSNSGSFSNPFQPIKCYKQLFPQQQQLADELATIIRTHNANESFSICISGKWGAGKTSVMNGAIDQLKQNQAPSEFDKYEFIYINTMELDTQSSLVTYVFSRIRSILKKRKAYVGVGSEYRQFLSSAVGKITDASLATIIESRLFPSSDDYRTQIKELEDCIATTLKEDKILIIVDDVERCDIEKAQQFIFLIKEIATIRNCITVFLADYEYLEQRLNASFPMDASNPNTKEYFFYEKFFNLRIDVPPIIFEEAIRQIEQNIREYAKKLELRLPSELFGIFEEKLQQQERTLKNNAATTKDSAKEKELLNFANKVKQLYSAFRSNLSSPRMLVKFCAAMENAYSKLCNAYLENDTLGAETSNFFSLIRFDEILFLLSYVEVCSPHKAMRLKEFGLSYLWQLSDTTEDVEKLIYEMGQDLLYNEHSYSAVNQNYRYSEASRFTQAYLNSDLPKTVKSFPNRVENWLYEIKSGNKSLMRAHWAEMVQTVAMNFGWKKYEEGENYLDLLFSFAKEELLPSPEGVEQVFSIFDKSQRNGEIFASHLAVMKLFDEKLGSSLEKCSQKNVKLLEQFSTSYFWQRTSPICSAANFMVPAEYGKNEDFQRKMSDANDIMLSSNDLVISLNNLLDKICKDAPSIDIPQNNNVFCRLRSFSDAEEKYMTETGLIQYDDIKDRLHLLKTAIEDMEHFVLLQKKIKAKMVPTGDTISTMDLSNMDKTIQQFKDALNVPNAAKDSSLRLNLQTLFSRIRFGDIKLSEQHYKELQDIVTISEKIFGFMPYNRKILLDHRECNKQKGDD